VNTEINAYVHRKLIFFTKMPRAYIGEKTASLINSAGKTGHPCAEE
jgi:hypothetical protein